LREKKAVGPRDIVPEASSLPPLLAEETIPVRR
jgi:hypothetical protein